ncbi:MAG TPA: MBL fold metallo-hydrolase [Baekduia sp.]|nr:MBL fold metallo-hydrolase [Baekduia sp.]
MLPAWLEVDVRPAPGANVVLARDPGGGAPSLVDSGSPTVVGTRRTAAFLAAHGLAPGDVAQVVCTHWHCDHVGGCAWLQAEHGVPVAAHASEAALVNARDPRACDTTWLGNEVGPYRVDRALEDGEHVAAGPGFEVVHIPSQTPGHVALWQPEDRVLITGDHLQAGDVAWVPVGGPWQDGALERSIAAVHRLAALRPRLVVPGHGPVVTDPDAAIERALHRYALWRERPELAAWHAVRRIAVSAVVSAPADPADPAARFAGLPCLEDAARLLDRAPAALARELVAEFLERGVLAVRDGRVVATIEHEPPSPLRIGPGSPEAWPPA